MHAPAGQNDPDRQIIVNRAPVCATCRYFRKVTTGGGQVSTTTSGPFGLWSRTYTQSIPTREILCCAIGRDPITGFDPRHYRLMPECLHERQNEYGCGPSGRNYLYNPEWIAALKKKGIPVHPDLEALFDAPDVVEAESATADRD